MLYSILAVSCVALASCALPNTYPVVPIKGVHGVISMPMIGLGTWQLNNTVAAQSVLAAFESGYRAVDTAVVYKNHPGVGKALKKSGVERDQYFLTTKIPGGLNTSASQAALDQSLIDLGVDYVDLMLLHFPGSTSLENQKQWLVLEQWAKSGKARAIGVSHYCRHHVDSILSVATLPVAVNQNQYHVGMGSDTEPRLHHKRYTESQGILFQAYSTLCGPCDGGGNMELVNGPLVTEIGKAHNKSGAQVSLRWVVQQGIPIIPKSTSAKHLQDNFNLFDFELTQEEMERLTKATSPSETGTPEHPDDAQDCPAETSGKFEVFYS